MLEIFATRLPEPSSIFRVNFANLLLGESTSHHNHSHPISAGSRGVASRFCERFCNLIQYQPFFVQMSKSDQRLGRTGSRVYYWAKDLNASTSTTIPDGRHVKVIIDVDYYMDMPSQLSTDPVPYLLYTFVPSAAASVNTEYSYTFNSDNEVEYTVCGGGQYKHMVWDYGTDSLLAFKTLFGIRYSATTYNVDTRQIDNDHSVILLTPLTHYGPLTAWLTYFLSGTTLKRFLPAQNGFVRFQVHNKGLQVTTARVGTHNAVTVSKIQDDTVASMQKISKLGLTLSSVTSIVKDRDQAAVLTEYYNNCTPRVMPTVYPVQYSVRSYQFNPDNHEECKPAMVAFMSPFINDGFVPDNCLNNEKQAIRGRIEQCRSVAKSTKFIQNCMREYITLFAKGRQHTLRMCTHEDVLKRQSRPSQRARLDKANKEENNFCQIFLKKEPMSNVSDPRIITTFGPTLLSNSSRVDYALQEFLVSEHGDWFAPGHNPIDVAQMVCDVCVKATDFVDCGDYHRYDGHVGPVHREFDQLFLSTMFVIEEVD